MLERKFSLSNQKFFGWLKEHIKRNLLFVVLGLPLIELIYLFLRHFPQNWWIIGGLVWIVFSVLLSKLAPQLIIPLFYKCKPLDNEALKKRLLSLATKSGISVPDVYELNLSKNTKKANAGLVGIGNTRRIVLSDTLLENYSPPEIEVILAHELGHHKFLHRWKFLAFEAVATFVGLYLAALSLRWSIQAFGMGAIHDISLFPFLCLVLFVFGLVVMPLQNSFSRYLEKQADRYALEKTKLKESFILAMSKLARQNMADPSPSRLVKLFLYSHPPISERIRMARRFAEQNK